MKKFLIVLIILSFAGIGSAQGFKLGVAGTAAFPTGNWSEFTSTGYGVDAFGVFDIMLLTLTVRAGYLSFGENETELGLYTTSTKAIPVMAGLRWDFGLPVGPSFYAGVEAGIHAFTTTYESSGTIVADPDDTETKFALAPNVGLEFAGFDLSAYYMIISDANYWGLRLGWGIGI